MPLLVGAALAFLWTPSGCRRGKTGTLAPGRRWMRSGPSLSAMVLITFLTVHDYDPSLYHGGWLLLLSVWTALLVGRPGPPGGEHRLRWSGNPAMRWLGLRSYSFYLWHWPILELTRPGSTYQLPRADPVRAAAPAPRSCSRTSRTATWSSPSAARAAGERPDWLRIGRVGIAVGVASVVLIVGWSGIVPRGHPGQLRVASAEITPKTVSIRPEGASHPISVTRAISDQWRAWSRSRPVANMPMARPSRSRCWPWAIPSWSTPGRPGSAARTRLTLNAAVGRQPAEIPRCSTPTAHGKLPDNVVLQMGNNGPVYSDDLEKLQAALKASPRLPRERRGAEELAGRGQFGALGGAPATGDRPSWWTGTRWPPPTVASPPTAFT